MEIDSTTAKLSSTIFLQNSCGKKEAKIATCFFKNDEQDSRFNFLTTFFAIRTNKRAFHSN